MKVLVIEDSNSQRRIINKIIRPIADVEPILAEDALEGFAILRAIPNIKLIVLDNLMPYMNGIDFLKKIRSTFPFEKLPILISSAEDCKQKYLIAGADKVLLKPYHVSELTNFIQLIKSKQ